MKKDNKKDHIIISSLLSGIFVMILIGIIFIPNSKASNNTEDKILNLSNTFYKDYYYKQLIDAYDNEKLVLFLSYYSDIGIKVDLENLKLYASLDNKNISDLDFINNCNSKKSYVIFYPKEPYEVDDYKTEIILDCK